MPLIHSISGIRGTLGGSFSDGLNPVNTAQFVAAFGTWVNRNPRIAIGATGSKKEKKKIIIGRDARTSGGMFSQVVSGVLMGLGIDVIDIGPAPTPTVELAVTDEKGDGGIILTASHNPKEWNALKLLNRQGEFLSDEAGREVLRIATTRSFDFAPYNSIGCLAKNTTAIQRHIEKILSLPLVDVRTIRSKKFKVVIDCVNSVGAISLPPLLEALGVSEINPLHCVADGLFPHNPEPLPENLHAISNAMRKQKADVGFAVDPDVDRLAIICEDGSMFGEEYTLVAVADFVLSHKKGNTVSNLSSTRALKDITEKHGGKYNASAVGEVNVVEMMKKNHAVIGGEGNGGIIYPGLHYGRDALVGIALFLSHLSKSGKTCRTLRETYPDYYISKNKITLTPEINTDKIFAAIESKYKKYRINKVDGLKIEFDQNWVHLRKSNTEPIIRIYAESNSMTAADNLTKKIIQDIKETITHKLINS